MHALRLRPAVSQLRLLTDTTAHIIETLSNWHALWSPVVAHKLALTFTLVYWLHIPPGSVGAHFKSLTEDIHWQYWPVLVMVEQSVFPHWSQVNLESKLLSVNSVHLSVDVSK